MVMRLQLGTIEQALMLVGVVVEVRSVDGTSGRLEHIVVRRTAIRRSKGRLVGFIVYCL